MSNYIHPLQQQDFISSSVKKRKPSVSQSFEQILSNITELKVSKHAKTRLEQRDIHIPKDKWEMIGEKVNEAKTKGITDALVVLDDATLVVSAKNNTVITALHRDDANEKIFTNINGTIIL